MTQAQQDAVVAAQQKFFAAAMANTEAQALAAQAANTTAAALKDATVTTPAKCKALQSASTDAYYKAQADQTVAINAAQASQAALGQAQLELQNAINDSFQTGAVEQP